MTQPMIATNSATKITHVEVIKAPIIPASANPRLANPATNFPHLCLTKVVTKINENVVIKMIAPLSLPLNKTVPLTPQALKIAIMNNHNPDIHNVTFENVILIMILPYFIFIAILVFSPLGIFHYYYNKIKKFC
jgi:hypothetical protein